MSNSRQVFFNSDGNGITLLSVAVYSLLTANASGKRITVFIAHDRTFAERGGVERIRAIAGRFPDAKVVFLDYTSVQIACGEIFKPALWAFSLCDKLLPIDVTGNIVYLDIDMLIRKDLGELFDLDLSTRGFVAAAVNESRREHRRYLVEAEWPDAAGYSFNNATTVLDLDAFRRERMSDKMIDWYRRNFRTAVNLDQDAQNVAYGDRTLRLHPKWNYTDGWLERLLKLNPFAREWRVHPPREILEAILEPAIIHYIGRKKPTSWNHRPERKVYRRAMSELGLLENGRLPGETPARKAVAVLFDGYHGLLKLYARLLLALISPKAPTPMRQALSSC